MTDELRLEAPDSPDALYLFRGEIVPVFRPFSTGDVFSGAIGDNEPGEDTWFIVLTHPCSMRTNGVELASRLLVAPVVPYQKVPLHKWTGHYRKMPLPELLGDGQHLAVDFDAIETIKSSRLGAEDRIAVLEIQGVNLLLQRLVNHMSRVVVPTDDFTVACAGPMEELEIVEHWLEEAVADGLDSAAAAEACHDWLRSDSGDGLSWQQRLEKPSERASVRRQARQTGRDWREAEATRE